MAEPRIRGVKETCLYVDDVPRAVAFYRDLFQFPVISQDERLCAFDVCGDHVLLLFLRGATLESLQFPGGVIPPHDGAGPVHIGFAMDLEDVSAWEDQLSSRGIAIESRFEWDRGGTSLYFRDPDGHLLELLTPGVWPTF